MKEITGGDARLRFKRGKSAGDREIIPSDSKNEKTTAKIC